MFNKRKNRFGNFFKNTPKGSPAEKMRLTWFLVSVCMVGVFFLWVRSAQNNFARMASLRMDIPAMSSLPEVSGIDFGGIMEDSGEKYEEYAAADQAHWQAVGDAYIAEKGILEGDGFSSLKFSGSKEEDGAMSLEYAQYYKEIPVLGYGLVLSSSSDGSSVVEKSSNLATGINLDADPAVSLKEAGTIAEKSQGSGKYAFREGSLAVVRYEDEFYLVWKIALSSEKEADVKEVLVGARRGGIIEAQTAGTENQTSNIAE